MFRIADKNELNQISLTGVRGIVILGLLMVKPHSLEEIKDTFINLNLLDKSSSTDVIRIDMNTLKHIGCEISRASMKTDYKYVLGDHPFTIKISDEELNVLQRIYKYFKETSSLYSLIQMDELFNKIARHVGNKEVKEKFLGISMLKYVNNDIARELLYDCEQQNIVEILYYNKVRSEETNKLVLAQKIVIQNDKLYLYAYDLRKKESLMLPLSRIRSVISRTLKDCSIDIKTTNIKFKLTNCNKEDLDFYEEIVEFTENGFIVEGHYHNEFIAMQRVLSFGSKCTVYEPESFKSKIIEKLKQMRGVYGE